jgi:hypothetical protein
VRFRRRPNRPLRLLESHRSIQLFSIGAVYFSHVLDCDVALLSVPGRLLLRSISMILAGKAAKQTG